ncbi:MAG: acetyl-CoA carboxylase biotin carboxyl carrier protein subunit [Bacteroidales bacterium]|nr:acetyl-CoA carboxylase biotin carboxyl carrier protein subunit [Bacteroidales bacterium]
MKKYKFTINGTTYEVDINNTEGQKIELEVNGTPYTVMLDQEVKQTKTPKLLRPQVAPSTDINKQEAKTAKRGGSISSPLPGVILDVYVKPGDTITVGQKVILLEAMKMENNIEADKEGVVAEVKVEKGNSVMEGDVLIIMGE